MSLKAWNSNLPASQKSARTEPLDNRGERPLGYISLRPTPVEWVWIVFVALLSFLADSIAGSSDGRFLGGLMGVLLLRRGIEWANGVLGCLDVIAHQRQEVTQPHRSAPSRGEADE